ncbi:MAG TPA: family 1 glycosylhydrolase [Solirubrobacteraceae bacterium]|nr:family 1 glycosylhydrolase [Solirubrobacteraceae bacterium]
MEQPDPQPRTATGTGAVDSRTTSGLAVEAIRAALPGRVPVRIAIDIHPVRAANEDAAQAAAALEAEDNRIFLEPVLHASYPEAARAELLPGAELIEPDDMGRIAAPIDFLGLNYYTPYYVPPRRLGRPRTAVPPTTTSPQRGERRTQRRLPKRSAAFYSKVARANALPTDDAALSEDGLPTPVALRAS